MYNYVCITYFLLNTSEEILSHNTTIRNNYQAIRILDSDKIFCVVPIKNSIHST